MAANGYTLDFRRGVTAAGLEPTRERVDCDWSAASRAGREHARNGDAWQVAPDSGVFVLADGQGGHNAGDVASRLVVERLAERMTDADAEAGAASAIDPLRRLAQRIGAANADILAAAARRPECLGMASTVACLWVGPRQFCIGHVGHSRIYLLRGTRFVRLTRDHVLARDVDDGRPATLSRVLGVEPSVDIDVRQADWYHGDRLLLCTDGLSDVVGDDRIADVMQGSASASDCVDTLTAAALAASGRDSVTVIGVFLSRSFTLA
ncbi:MAG: protein phosphatase 2C domain-containing protein [Burkholderiaceae bacterium]